MALVLFLFLMSAFAETLEIEWKNVGIGCIHSMIRHWSGFGQWRRETTWAYLPKDYLLRSLAAVEILQCLYVNDEAFIFTSWTDLTKGLELIYKHPLVWTQNSYQTRRIIPLKDGMCLLPYRLFWFALPCTSTGQHWIWHHHPSGWTWQHYHWRWW